MALDVTVGGENSNSYQSIAGADAYFKNHYSLSKAAAWDELSTGRKESALKRACQQIETIKMLDSELGSGALPAALVLFEGYEITVHKMMQYQRLQFPRNLDMDSDGVAFIPLEVKDAQCEQAIHMIVFDDASLIQSQSGIVEEAVTAGEVKAYTKYAEGKIPTYISSMAAELLRPYFRNSSRVRRA